MTTTSSERDDQTNKTKNPKVEDEDDDSLSLSLSLSAALLPDNKQENSEVDSSISEHLSDDKSVENDRSFQEIEVRNTPTSLNLVLHDLSRENLSQENKPSTLFSLTKSDQSLKDEEKEEEEEQEATLTSISATSGVKNVKSIIDDILNNEQFIKSKSSGKQQHTLMQQNNNITCVTNDEDDDSINIFEGVNLDDDSINEYVSKLKSSGPGGGGKSLPLSGSEFCGALNLNLNYEEVIAAKDATIAILAAELDSFRSTLSLNTSTTDYKPYQEEFQNKIVEFQNALAHRDVIIQQLTESLQQQLTSRDELQAQSKQFVEEIVDLKEKLKIIKQHNCNSKASKFEIEDEKIQQQQQQEKALSSFQVFEDKKAEVKEPLCVKKFVSPLGSLEPTIATQNLFQKLEEMLQNDSQLIVLNELKKSVECYVEEKLKDCKEMQNNEVKILKDKFENEKAEHEIEVTRLRNLLEGVKCGSTEIMELRQELDAKHAHEMEELRTYFEQKCADLEKQKDAAEARYSEEVFSQQSRKMSGSSSLSEVELPIDLMYNSQSGPAGDCGLPTSTQYDDNFSKKDFIKLKSELTAILRELEKHELENISKEDLAKLKLDIGKHELKALLKYDLNKMKNELTNKYHAELEILREDYENRIDLLNVEHETKIQQLEKGYEDKMESLKYELEEALRNNELSISTAVQEVASSGEYELAEVVQSYERRLQEQVMLAKIDIIAALENQIQMLCSSGVNDDDWPQELVQLRNKFTEKYEKEISNLKDQHSNEISCLKEEHLKTLNGALERARRRSINKEDSSDSDLILKERDYYKKNTVNLKQLLRELLKYFTDCEQELNNTLVEEMIKNCSSNISQIDDQESSQSANSSVLSENSSAQNQALKRVHFTPDFSEFLNILDESSSNFQEDDKNFSLDLKNELGMCLERLRNDALAILALSMPSNPNQSNASNITMKEFNRTTSIEDKLAVLNKQLVEENQAKNNVKSELVKTQELLEETLSEKTELEKQFKALENNYLQTKERLAELINKEIVTEGFGERENQNQSIHNNNNAINEKRRVTLNELQEKARILVADNKITTTDDGALIQLIDELCREGDLILEEAKKEQDDLKQQGVVEPKLLLLPPHPLLPPLRSTEKQIEAADKKLKANCKFLEEQALEREQERDEFQKEIVDLKEQLKERERDRLSCEIVSKEVEHLEQQMREMSQMLEENSGRQQELEKERDEAVDQIYLLRDVIKGLETQVLKKAETENELRAVIHGLEDIVKQQTKSNNELSDELHSLKDGIDVNDFREHVAHLEEEVNKLRLSNELAGSEGALYQMKTQLQEFEISIEKRTKELENLHSAISTTSCSSPTEDMSIRDQVRPNTPGNNVPLLDECDVPLQQLARLKEKLIKHSRAEEAAIKRIRDMEMQMLSNKTEFEEIQNEKDLLQDQVSEQLVLISSLQMRLDEQRMRAEHVEKQTNTSLEVRIYDLESQIQNLMEIIHQKEKLIKQLNKSLEQTKQRLLDREKELNEENSLEKELLNLKAENEVLKTKISVDAQSAQILPNLVDNILADKNADIEKLREELDETKKQLFGYLSLNLSEEEVRTLSCLKTQNPGNSFTEILSILQEPETLRRAESMQHTADDLSASSSPFSQTHTKIERKSPPAVVFEPEISAIKIPANSTGKHVHFVEVEEEESERENSQIVALKNELLAKEAIIQEYHERMGSLAQLEQSINQLQLNLESTELTLNNTTETFEKKQEEMREIEKQLRVDLAEKKMHLLEKEKELEDLKEDAKRRDQMYMDLAKEKRDLDQEFNVKKQEISKLEERLQEINDTSKKFVELELNFDQKCKELELLEEKYIFIEKELEEKSEKNEKLMKDLSNKNTQVDALLEELDATKTQFKKQKENHKDAEEIASLKDKLKKVEEVLLDKQCELEIINEDNNRYQNEIIKFEEKLNYEVIKNRKIIAEKELEIVKLKEIVDELKKEVHHLQDFLNEKDKVIEQMKSDSLSLKNNLESIQRKMTETGNIVDLKKKLSEQLHINKVLNQELECLKSKPNIDMTMSIEEITGKVAKELNYSAQLDSNILSALNSSNDDNADNVQEEEAEIIEQLRQELFQEKEVKNSLQLEIQELQDRLNSVQIEDGNLIEKLHVHLKNALDSENELKLFIEQERTKRQILEDELKKLKKKANNLSTSSNSKTELTEYKSLPTLQSQELIALKSENEKLNNDNKKLNKIRKELENNKKVMSGEIAKLQEFNRDLRKELDCVKEALIKKEVELNNKGEEKEELLKTIKELDEQKKLAELLLQEERNSAQLTSSVPDKFMKKMKDLSTLVQDHVRDNKIMVETITRLTEERRILQEKLSNLEEGHKLPFDDPMARANHLFGKYLRSESYRKALVWQKRYLISLLASYQSYQMPQILVKFDPKHPVTFRNTGKKRFKSVAILVIAVSRMEYLVKRWNTGKRLASQKSFSFYQRNAATTQPDVQIQVLPPQPPQFQLGQPVSSQNFPSPDFLNRHPSNHIHCSQRIDLIDNQATTQHINTATYHAIPGTSTNTNANANTNASKNTIIPPPWSGNSPPSKDNSNSNERLVMREPLKSPDLLSKYVDRFNQIQTRLGLTLGDNLQLQQHQQQQQQQASHEL